jgi:hypothetical protein
MVMTSSVVFVADIINGHSDLSDGSDEGSEDELKEGRGAEQEDLLFITR